jgi:cytochrome c2
VKLPHFASLMIVSGLCVGCSSSTAPVSTGQQTAPDLMIQYGCPTCHVIPHVPGAVGKVGPSLASLSQRSYLAGQLQNSPGNLVRWLREPQQIHPGTAMPNMGLSEADAKTIAAFLERGS